MRSFSSMAILIAVPRDAGDIFQHPCGHMARTLDGYLTRRWDRRARRDAPRGLPPTASRRFDMRKPGQLLLVVLLAFVSPLVVGARAARAGGVPMPEALPPYWITVKPGPGAQILEFLKTIPQDPNTLGVRAALFRTKEYDYTFIRTTFPSLDGVPLVARWNGQRYPRPGVVLVHGFIQSKDHKFIVELAEMFSRNGWSVLAFDLRDHGETRQASKAPFTNGWKE